MKLGFISVLHIDDNRGWSPEFFVTAMNKVLQDKDLDYFFNGGDISNCYQKTLSFVEEL